MNLQIENRFKEVRRQTLILTGPLHPEDTVIQPVNDVSPPKWHLAHTTWFFENFILKKFIPGYKTFHKDFDYLFNSYYESQGERVKRDSRGFHPRPLLSEVFEYRKYVDAQVLSLIKSNQANSELTGLMELGIQHEQQHQELLVTDLKYIWSISPMSPVYKESRVGESEKPGKTRWLSIEEGIYSTGYSGKSFHFDNEAPDHKSYIYGYEIASQPVTNGEYLEFIEAGGYQDWKLWLHEGWKWLLENGVDCPLYWKQTGGDWYVFTLNGLKKLKRDEVLTHISFYEADAYARWKGARLPSEQEWETAARIYGTKDSLNNFLEEDLFHPTSVSGEDTAFLGQVWEWTNSAYLPYPGFKPWEGSIAEYNGKFMVSQMVLRGGSCVTPKDHIRLSYRNFFHPWLRWQFTGIRLAKDI